MTDAERQRRRRKRLKREKKAAEKEAARQKNLELVKEAAKAEWTQGIILPPETVEEWACRELTHEVGYNDEEVLGLLEQIQAIARERGLID